MKNSINDEQRSNKIGAILYRAINVLLYVTVIFVFVGIYLKNTVPAVFYISLAWTALYIIGLVFYLRAVIKRQKQQMEKAKAEKPDGPEPTNPLFLKILEAYRTDGLSFFAREIKKNKWHIHYSEEIKNEVYLNIARGYNEVFVVFDNENITLNFDEESDDITLTEPVDCEKYVSTEELFLHLSEMIERHYKPSSPGDKN